MRTESLKKILFLDIETVSNSASYELLSDRMKELWNVKARSILKNQELTLKECIECYNDKSAIYAEFNRIICISVGYLDYRKDEVLLKVKSFFGDDEKEILLDFKSLLNKHYDNTEKDFLCGHNIKEFDCPVICRRMLVHQIEHPKLLKLSRKKPWHLMHLLDTLEMWKFGDYKNYISLDLLAAVMGVASPKDDINGSMVSSVYWKDNNLERIKDYCQKDVVTTANVFLRMILEKPFDRVKYVTS